jgi:hypothetical protein
MGQVMPDGILVHPNLLPVPSGPPEGGVWLAEQIAEQRTAPVTASLGWLREMAEVLDFAHRRGFAHGRLGPAWIWITDAGHIRLAGLGQHPEATTAQDQEALFGLAVLLIGERAPALERVRFQSCTAFVEALRRALDEAPADHAPAEYGPRRRQIAGDELVRWTLVGALTLSAAGVSALALFLAP